MHFKCIKKHNFIPRSYLIIMLLSPKFFLPISPIYLIFELKLLLQHFGEQRQAKRLVFIEKYASKHV